MESLVNTKVSFADYEYISKIRDTNGRITTTVLLVMGYITEGIDGMKWNRKKPSCRL